MQQQLKKLENELRNTKTELTSVKQELRILQDQVKQNTKATNDRFASLEAQINKLSAEVKHQAAKK